MPASEMLVIIIINMINFLFKVIYIQYLVKFKINLFQRCEKYINISLTEINSLLTK